jgi:hypothetical protein
MNEQNFEERVNTTDVVERTDQGMYAPAFVNPDPFADKAPVEMALIREMPMDETVAATDTMDETIAHATPISETISHEDPILTNAGVSVAPLFTSEEAEHFRTRWNTIQGNFVDEPRSAVQQADALVTEVIEKINRLFADEHGSLEGQWNQGDDVSTEDLRRALQHYRSFFNRLMV